MSTKAFTRYAWFVTGYNILVILWGAVVRATGSGAGCGSHWPSCNGAVIPQPERIETLIEFSHRVTSGMSGVFVIMLVVWAFRSKTISFTRSMAIWSLVFVLIEGGVGAMLVRLELVEDNASTLRAVVIAFHLLNTFFLLGSLTLAAWSSGTRRSILWAKLHGRVAVLLLVALAGTAILSSAGAITALGDTLFPPESLAEGIQQDLDPTANFLIRLRVIHPLIAIGVSLYLFLIGSTFARQSPLAQRYTRIMYGLVTVQLAAGVINIALLAPVWMQVVHLLLADLLWITLVILAAQITAEPTPGPT